MDPPSAKDNPISMSLPSGSSPLDNVVQKLQTDLLRSVDLCQAIRENRHIGPIHKELDDLEKSLRDGPSFVQSEANRAKDLPEADVAGGDGESTVLKCFPPR
jgi:hypothetical protein